MKCLCLSYFFSVARPTVTVNPRGAKTLDISWTSGGPLVMEYQVTWEKLLGKCRDMDDGSATITNGSRSYAITGLKEDSNYTINVTATNAAGSSNSVPISAATAEASKDA